MPRQTREGAELYYRSRSVKELRLKLRQRDVRLKTGYVKKELLVQHFFQWEEAEMKNHTAVIYLSEGEAFVC